MWFRFSRCYLTKAQNLSWLKLEKKKKRKAAGKTEDLQMLILKNCIWGKKLYDFVSNVKQVKLFAKNYFTN